MRSSLGVTALVLVSILVAANLAVAGATDRAVTVQPIQVRSDDGTVAAPINLLKVWTNQILEQAAIKVSYASTVTLDKTEFLDIADYAEAKQLFAGAGNGQHSNGLVLNLWFVDSISDQVGNSRSEYAQINQNGMVVDGNLTEGLEPLVYLLSRVICCNLGLFPSDLGPDFLMDRDPTIPLGLDQIFPTGSLCRLDTEDVNTLRASSWVTEEPVSEFVASWGEVKATFQD